LAALVADFRSGVCPGELDCSVIPAPTHKRASNTATTVYREIATPPREHI
jgi:hypothetical protein